MTKTGISEKLRQYSTPLRASLFAFVCICPSIGLSDGTCTLTQLPSGEYTIVCEGDGIVVNYAERTNDVYVIENCEELKRQLSDSVRSIDWSLSTVARDLDDCYSYVSNIYTYASTLTDNSFAKDEIVSSAHGVESYLDTLDSRLLVVRKELAGNPEPEEGVSLLTQIANIRCGSCSTNNSGSCCDVDLSPILDRMNEAQLLRISLTNSLSSVLSALGSYVGGNVNARYWRDYINLASGKESVSLFSQSVAGNNVQRNVINLLSLLHNNLALSQASINNYLYHISHEQLYSISNSLYSISNNVEVLRVASTNFFSFFITNISVKSVLGDWRSENQDGSYYNFLTNHYIKVSRDNFDGMSESQQSKTNWFARIETLIASLVFADSVESTNTVDSVKAENESDTILSRSLDGVNGVKNVSSSQLNVFRGTSQNIITSLRSISSSFSSVSDPGTIVLARLGTDNSSGVGPRVSFETSEIRNLVEACHCVTTLCWCLGGLLLLYYFLHWTVKTSYGLVMFAWGVFSAIFKH